VCALANSHVLDFREVGLLETMDTLAGAGVRSAGAGRTLGEAREPARVGNPGRRAAVRLLLRRRDERDSPELGGDGRSVGIDRLPDLSESTARGIRERV
jgi:poly-gamma-glutamate capsule biosynthesis protein CapA/YwtB (metallophosphatase superfamily)